MPRRGKMPKPTSALGGQAALGADFATNQTMRLPMPAPPTQKRTPNPLAEQIAAREKQRAALERGQQPLPVAPWGHKGMPEWRPRTRPAVR